MSYLLFSGPSKFTGLLSQSAGRIAVDHVFLNLDILIADPSNFYTR